MLASRLQVLGRQALLCGQGSALSLLDGSLVFLSSQGGCQGQAQQQNRGHRTMPEHRSSVDAKEAAKFAQLSAQWWDPSGPFAPLLRMNTARCKFIRGVVCAMHGVDPALAEPLQGLKALDVGCGGGILSESLARMGAQVHGIDVTQENISAASSHAMLDPLVAGRVRYERIRLEALAGRVKDTSTGSSSQGSQAHTGSTGSDSSSGSTGRSTSSGGAGSSTDSSSRQGQLPQYELVVASEVIEHVKRPDVFIKDLASLTVPGGTVVLSTINRTPASFAVAIVGAEYVSGIVPKGTHHWDKFITPEELAIMTRHAGLEMVHAAGMALSPRSGTFSLNSDLSSNYIAAFHKPVSAVN